MNFIRKHKILSTASIILLIFISGCILFFSISRIDGQLTGYYEHGFSEKSFYDSKHFVFYDMSEETAKDLLENFGDYRMYFVDVWIKNVTNNYIYGIRGNELSNNNSGIWIYRIGLAEWDICLDPGQEYNERISIIIKTRNLTEEEINKKIRSIGLIITSTDYSSEPLSYLIRNTKTIFFKN